MTARPLSPQEGARSRSPQINATPGLVKGSGGGRGTLSKSWLGSTRSSASVNLPPRMERTL